MIIEIIGIDGSGKTSVANYIANKSLLTNFVYLNPFENRELIHEAEYVAKKFKASKYDIFSNKFINYLWLSDLLNNYIYEVKPMLDAGKNIVFDRYIYNATIYSKLTTEINMDKCYSLLMEVLPVPDMYIYLDVQVKKALDRIYKRNKPIAFYENFNYLDKINNYIKEDIINKDNVIVINSNLEFELVCQQLNEKLKYLEKGLLLNK